MILRKLVSKNIILFYLLKKLQLFIFFYLKIPFEYDFAVFSSYKRNQTKKLFIIDIGANTGQSAIDLHRIFPSAKILSFEINKALRPFLCICQKLLKNKMSFKIVGLSSTISYCNFYVPKINKVFIYGEGSLNKKFFGYDNVYKRIGSYSLCKTKVRLRTLDSFKLNPDIIKIDVQGHEIDVLRGAVKTIKRSLPLLFIENNCMSKEVIQYLHNFNYMQIPIKHGKPITKNTEFSTVNNILFIQPKHLSFFSRTKV